MNDMEKIPGCKAILVTDEQNEFIKVATITNRYDRIIRMVVKGEYSVTVETSLLMTGQYQWMNESVHIGLEELAEMGRIAQYLLDKQEE